MILEVAMKSGIRAGEFTLGQQRARLGKRVGRLLALGRKRAKKRQAECA